MRISSLYNFYKGAFTDKYKVLAILVLMIALHSFFYFWAPSGYNASDDMNYAGIAYEISQNNFHPHPQSLYFYNRFGLTVPTAFSYLIFGVNRFSTTLWPLLCSIITIVLVFTVVLKFFEKSAALFSSFLLATNLIQIKYSSALNSDIVVSMFMTCGVIALFWARRTDSIRQKQLCVVLCAFSLFFGLLSKVSVLWVVPFMVVVMVYDLLRSKNFQLWIWLCLMGICMAIVYFGGYYVVTGDWLFSIKCIEQVHNVSRWSFFGRTYTEYAKRLTYQPLLFILRHPGYAILFIFSLPALLNLFRPSSKFPSGTRFWAGYSVMLLLSFWFGTTSLISHNPLPIAGRFLIPLLAPFSILSGNTIARLFSKTPNSVNNKRSSAVFILGAFLLSLVLTIATGGLRSIVLYSGLSVIIFSLILSLQLRLQYLQRAVKLALIVLLLAIPFFAVIYGALGESPPQRAEREIVQNHLLKLHESALVFTDFRSVSALSFYFGFSLPSNIKLINWSELIDYENIVEPKLFIFINKPRIEFLNWAYGVKIPDYVQDQPPSWKLIEGRNGIYLFKISSISDRGR